MDELAKQNHTYQLSTKDFKRYQGQWYLTLHESGKKAPIDFDQIFELQSLSKTVSTASQVSKLQNQFLHNNIGDGNLPQAIPGGTRPKVGGADNQNWSDLFLLQFVSFTVDGDPF